MKGIKGKICHINLSNQTYKVEEPDDIFYRKYLGGKGFALPYMLANMPAKANPYGSENIIVFATSIIVGAKGPAIPRVTVCAKSPLTGGFGESEAGGWWGPELKKAGFDAITVTGIAPKPVYIWIKDGEVVFKDASNLWGLETGITQELIRQELNDSKVRVLQIGPGGERKIRYAAITNELAHFNGRNGLGAVMGAKKLKAIAVRGSQDIDVADSVKVTKIARWAATEGMKNPLAKMLRELGTPALMKPSHLAGVLPTRNWNRSTFVNIDKISGEYFKANIFSTPAGCFACPIRCKRRAVVKAEGLKTEPRYGGPEYETIAALGSILEIDDAKIIAYANELCNKNTIDTISLGMTIAFAMECFENGLLTKEMCDGLEIRFGNNEVLIPLLEKIIKREGVGDLLAEGSVAFSEHLSPAAKKYLVVSKKQEVPMHDPRKKTGVGLGYAVSDFGADHLLAPHDGLFATADSPGLTLVKMMGIYEPVAVDVLTAQKVALFVYSNLYWTMFDCLGICIFGFAPRGPIPPEMMIELVEGVTGWKVSLWELMKAAERSINLSRIFNLREGFSREDDTLSEKFFQNFNDGPNRGEGALDKAEFAKALTLRYQMMGWNAENTRPFSAKLHELGIGWAEKYLDE